MRNGTAGFIAFCILAVVAADAGAARIQTSLDTLVPGVNDGGLVIGGMRYSEFSFASEGDFRVDAADVTVRADNENIPDHFLHLIFDVDALAGQAGRVTFGYRVQALSASWDGSGRAGTRFVPPTVPEGPGPGSIEVIKRLSTVSGADLDPLLPPGDSSAEFRLFNDGPGRLEDVNSAFTGTGFNSDLLVRKEVTLTATGDGRFSVHLMDSFRLVPEPSGAALLVAAVAALGARPKRARRQRRAAAPTAAPTQSPPPSDHPDPRGRGAPRAPRRPPGRLVN